MWLDDLAYALVSMSGKGFDPNGCTLPSFKPKQENRAALPKREKKPVEVRDDGILSESNKMIRALINDIKAAFAPPDPRRFSTTGATPWNWNGEHSGKELPKGGAILVNEERRVFEFGRYSNEEIADYLTDLDKQGLRKYNLDPEQPYYAQCKRYFSKNPYCTKKELSSNSGGDHFDPIKPDTAAKVLAAFRVGLVDKPTF